MLITKVHFYLRNYLACFKLIKFKLAALITWAGFCSLKTIATPHVTALWTAKAQAF